jgi:hypothetical protein
MKHWIVGVAVAGAFLATAVPAARAASPATVIKGECSREVDGYGLVTGQGILVIAPSGQVVSVCQIAVSPPPPDTTVETFPGFGGDIVVVTAGGEAIAVFTPCGPSQPCG